MVPETLASRAPVLSRGLLKPSPTVGSQPSRRLAATKANRMHGSPLRVPRGIPTKWSTTTPGTRCRCEPDPKVLNITRHDTPHAIPPRRTISMAQHTVQCEPDHVVLSTPWPPASVRHRPNGLSAPGTPPRKAMPLTGRRNSATIATRDSVARWFLCPGELFTQPPTGISARVRTRRLAWIVCVHHPSLPAISRHACIGPLAGQDFPPGLSNYDSEGRP